MSATPISYDLAGAANAVGLSIVSIQKAIRKGDLTPRYPNRKPLISHTDLVEWFEGLPVDRPGGDNA